MCLSIEASILGVLTGWTGSTICWYRNEGCDRGRAMYFLGHGTWQLLDAILWWDIDKNGNSCSEMNYFISNVLLPSVVCILIMFQMHFGELMLFFGGKTVHWTRWHTFKLFYGAGLCHFFLYDELNTGACTAIIDKPTMISSRLLEWCNQEFSYKAIFAYASSAVIGYDDPSEVSKTYALTQSTILYIAVSVILAQYVFFGSFHLSLFCFFCFGMIYPALFGPRKFVRSSKTLW